MSRLVATGVALVILGSHAVVAADDDGFEEMGQDLSLRRFASANEHSTFELHGALRLRGETLYNLDLDHGLTPSGQPLFPVPLADPTGQALHVADTRLRTDIAMHSPGGGVSVQVRIDVLDNLVLGSTPEGVPSTGRAPTPAASPGQRPPDQALRVKRAYGEVLTPFGLLAAGRMGSHWALGMVANGGECDGCDGGDSADRIAFVSALAGHLWAVSYDFSATGPTTPRRDAVRTIDIEPSDDVRTITLTTMRWHSDESLQRRRAAGRHSIEYGVYLAHRRQDNDVPAHYLPVAQPPAIDASQVVARGFRATAADLWLRYTNELVRIELEAVYSVADIEQPSLVPGVELDQSVSSRQFGVAFESELDLPVIDVGFDAGFASGDDAPGFGAFANATAGATMPGDLDGPQANLPSDTTVDNLRFHPDYRIDQILFREIIGTVTDAVYLRPNVSYQLFDVGHATFTARFAAIASWAVEGNSTPSGKQFLGVELDPTLRFETRDGFIGSLEYGLFLPGSAFDNAIATLAAEPAQLFRLRLEYMF